MCFLEVMCLKAQQNPDFIWVLCTCTANICNLSNSFFHCHGLMDPVCRTPLIFGPFHEGES